MLGVYLIDSLVEFGRELEIIVSHILDVEFNERALGSADNVVIFVLNLEKRLNAYDLILTKVKDMLLVGKKWLIRFVLF